MKRTVSLIMAVMFVLVMVTGCGGGSSAAGKYYIKAIDGEDIEAALMAELGEEEGFTIDDYLELLGISSLGEMMTIELKSDGTAVIVEVGEDDTIGTWKQNGNTITITADDDPVDFILNGNELSYDEDGSGYTFVKK